MTRIIIFMAMALCLWQEVQGQSPCLRLPGDITTNCTSDPSRSFPLGPMNFTHINQTAGLSTPEGRYKAFWIMGDGNFLFTPDGAVSDRAADMATLNTTYSYHRQGKYDITAVLVEKKSNGQPPEPNTRAAQMDNVSAKAENVATPAGTPFNTRINSPDRADVLPSAKIRLGGATTALAISTLLPKDIIPPSVVLVFFNSVRATRSVFEKADLFVTDANLKVSKPNYADADFTKNLTSNLPRSFVTASDARGYRDVIAMPVSVNPDKRISSFTEFRFFPLLKTKTTQPYINISQTSSDIANLNTRAQGQTQFLTLLLENAVPDGFNIISTAPTQQQQNFPITELSEAERARIYLILKTQFNELTIGMDTISLRLANGMFVRGAYHQVVDIVASIDPTGLEVLSVCPKDNNKYEVTMKMTVCNEGNVIESNVGVRIFNTKGIQILDPVFNDSNTLDAFLSNPTSSATVPSWSYNYKDLPGAYDESGQYADNKNCFDRTFSYKTDWTGVQALQTGSALTASVTFSGALINPTQDFPSAAFKEGVPVTPEIGYNCGPPKEDNCWWLYVILFALGLVAWWYWKMKKEEEGNSN
jgi:hypothetical protein